MPADTQLAVLQRIEGHLKMIADNGKRIADALESIAASEKQVAKFHQSTIGGA